MFDDLDAALQGGSPEKRAVMLRQITDLFPNEADRLNDQQVGVFDDVMVQLIDRIETRTLPEIGEGRTRETQNRFRQVVEAQRPAAASILAGPRGERAERLKLLFEDFTQIGLHQWLTETEKTSVSISNAALPFKSWESTAPGVGNA